MSLTQDDMDRMDESVQIRGVPAEITMRFARPGETFPETRSRPLPAWNVSAERRRYQLEL